jgi:hypothetical protein
MRRVAVLAVLLLAFAASPAAAATLAELKPCYVSAGPTDAERETVVIRGDGFTQESSVEVLFDGVVMGSALTGSVGEFELLLPAPYQAAGDRAFTVTVRDAVHQLSQTRRVTNLGMTVKPRTASPHTRVRFRGRGFTRDAPIYAHYLYGGVEQKTVRLGRGPGGPCGTFTAKRRLIPVDGARSGRWILQVDQRRRYSPEPDPVWVRRPIDVTEVRPRRAPRRSRA